MLGVQVAGCSGQGVAVQIPEASWGWNPFRDAASQSELHSQLSEPRRGHVLTRLPVDTFWEINWRQLKAKDPGDPGGNTTLEKKSLK